MKKYLIQNSLKRKHSKKENSMKKYHIQNSLKRKINMHEILLSLFLRPNIWGEGGGGKPVGKTPYIFLEAPQGDLGLSTSDSSKKESTVAGLEPAIPRSEVWCLIH